MIQLKNASGIREIARLARNQWHEHYEYCRIRDIHWQFDYEQRYAEMMLEEAVLLAQSRGLDKFAHELCTHFGAVLPQLDNKSE